MRVWRVVIVGLLALWGLAGVRAEAGFVVNRLVTCAGVENREPVGAAETFTVATDPVWCFLEAGQIAADTTVTVRWWWGERDMGSVGLTLKAGPRWRTQARKTIAGRTGDWRVEVVDAAGQVVTSAAFRVE